MKSKNRKVDL